MSLRVLPPEVISKIAAGEVIERPASVVKELVENSLDAGATDITVDVQDGGVLLIRVADNGCGIPRDSLSLVGQRHVTSKISTVADLEGISTLGFRGEALASIAAVAELEIVSRTESEAVGTSVVFKRGVIVEQESRARTRGTTVTVRHLFRHFPARLKFLRSPATESGHITSLVTHYAFAFPEVRFSLSVDGRVVIRTPGSGQLRDVVAEIYGPETAQQMVDVNWSDSALTVTGLTSLPTLYRLTKNYYSFSVNRRWVRSPLLVRAAEQAYAGWLTSGKNPIVVASVVLPVRDLDVNVHPRKVEVRFRQETVVFSAVEKAIKKALEASPVSTISPSPVVASEVSTSVSGQTAQSVPPPTAQSSLPSLQPDTNALPVLRVVGQLAGSYILAEGPDGLYLIDQHAAHERILYERVQSQLTGQTVEVQGLLDPVTVFLSPGQEKLYTADVADLLRQFGFDIEPFGHRSYLVRAVPAVVKNADPTAIVMELIETLDGREGESLLESISKSLACHGAVRAGQKLSHEEMRQLVRELELTRRPYTCPHGRPAIVRIDSKQLAKQFGRE